MAEEFCLILTQRMQASGFLKTLLLRRIGSSIHAGLSTAKRMLASWGSIDMEDEEHVSDGDESISASRELSRVLTSEERSVLERFVTALEANQERDPKYERVRELLIERE